MTAPMPPPIASPSTTIAHAPIPAGGQSDRVVSTAISMPIMPNRLPRRQLVDPLGAGRFQLNCKKLIEERCERAGSVKKVEWPPVPARPPFPHPPVRPRGGRREPAPRRFSGPPLAPLRWWHSSHVTKSPVPDGLAVLDGRVEGWRAGLGRCLCSVLPRPFVCGCHTISTVPRFQSPPRRTQYADSIAQ
jgi:hypothetical protein